MKRIICIICVISLCVPFLLVPSSADDMNYLDYITEITVSEEYNIVTCKFPASPFSMTIYPEFNADQPLQFRNVGQVITDFYTTQSYNINITPSSTNYLWLGNLPDDTELNIYLDVSYFDPESASPRPERDYYMDVRSPLGRFYYYDKNHTELKDYTNYQVNVGLYDTDGINDTYMMQGFIFDNPDGEDTVLPDETQFMKPVFIFHDVSFTDPTGGDNVTAEFHITEYEVIIFIDSLLLGGEYGEVLDEINQALASQGKHINTITGAIERVPIPKPPKNYDAYLADLRDEDSFFEFFSTDPDNPFFEVMGGINTVMGHYGDGMKAVSAFLGDLLELPYIASIGAISASVGLIGTFLGVSISIFKSSSSNRRGDVRNGSAGKKKE